MPRLSYRIIEFLKGHRGLSDREITNALIGPNAAQQPINQACRLLESRHIIFRRKRTDGRIGNYLFDKKVEDHLTHWHELGDQDNDILSENAIKHALEVWLQSQGWETTIA